MLEIFTGIIIFNAMMGLFGLSFFIAARKTKEVGIRKAFGAELHNILLILSKGLLGKLLLAFCIASPLMYFFGSAYVSFFSRHITIGVEVFLMGGLFSLLMLVIASGWKLYAAATANPVISLRNE